MFIMEPAVHLFHVAHCCKCGKEAPAGQRHCLACHAAYMRVWRKTHPLSEEQRRRDNCRSYLGVYIRRGKLQRGTCVVCKEGAIERAIEAHHADYAKPLVVEWLCRPHHVDLTWERLTLPQSA